MNNIKVSILIPVYEAEKYIVQCLRSVFNQSYDNIEYIFVNDATTDNSMILVSQIIHEFPNRESSCIIISNEKNKGIAETRNILLENATGDYIYFVDSDDFIEPDTINIFVNYATNNNADIVRCEYFKFYNGKSYPIPRKDIDCKDLISHCLSNDYGMESLWLLFIKKELFTVNDLRFSKSINGCEDFLMTIKLFYHTNKLIDIHKPFYHYRLDNTNSITHQSLSFRLYSIEATKEIISFLKEKNIYEKHKNAILNLMYTCKQHFLLNKEIRDVDKYINTFPESNSCYRQYKYSKKQKILLFLAEHHQVTILKTLLLLF